MSVKNTQEGRKTTYKQTTKNTKMDMSHSITKYILHFRKAILLTSGKPHRDVLFD